MSARPLLREAPDACQARVEAATALLLTAVEREHIVISGDLRVSERDAARLLGYAAGHLKNMRQEGGAPHHYCRGVGGGRISYRLSDIAVWIEERRESW